MIADCTFSAIPFVKEKMKIPVVSIGIIPLSETSKDLPPAGLGMTPSGSFFGKRKQDVLRFVADEVLFKKPNEVMRKILEDNGIAAEGSNLFDVLIRKSSLLLQSGTPGFEYKRSDLGKNIRFIGPLLPYKTKKKRKKWFSEKLIQYEKVVLVTQGTVETDASKIIVPTIEAFKDTNVLVVVTTGGSGTEVLRKKYPWENVIIEDFIPFADIMPYSDAYITNGGYGGVMLAIENELPMVVAGIHEGKNEINARVGYFNLGINLRTETPTPLQIRNSVTKLLTDLTYRRNVKRLHKEFSYYKPNELVALYVDKILAENEKPISLRQIRKQQTTVENELYEAHSS
jgi:hypothetical protein